MSQELQANFTILSSTVTEREVMQVSDIIIVIFSAIRARVGVSRRLPQFYHARVSLKRTSIKA